MKIPPLICLYCLKNKPKHVCEGNAYCDKHAPSNIFTKPSYKKIEEPMTSLWAYAHLKGYTQFANYNIDLETIVPTRIAEYELNKLLGSLSRL